MKMNKNVFITGSSCYFPNSPVQNDEMEDYLGLISGQHSRVRRLVLKQNGIVERYYALDKEQYITHTNAELAVESIRDLLKTNNIPASSIELLTCGTASADQMLPSHAAMVHGLLKEKPMEIFSASGICLACLQAFKIAYWSILSGEKHNAICSTSELCSPTLLSKNYDIEYEKCKDLGTEPYMALEKDFLRFMMSDGASALLLQDNPGTGRAFKVEWVEMTSYANELPTCMFMGAEKREDGELKSWKAFKTQEIVDRSLMVVKQDIKLLGSKLIPYWVDHIEDCLAKHNIDPKDITTIIPHSSSMIIYNNLIDEIERRNIALDRKRWYTNLSKVGNIASAAIFSALDAFWNSHELHSGEKILLLVPESGRFSFGTVLLTVV